MPYAPEQPAIESIPPVKEWSVLRLPWTGINELRRLRMPSLYLLTIESSPHFELPWSDLPQLGALNIYGSGFTTLQLWRLRDLDNCTISNCPELTVVDAHGLAYITNLNLDSCYAISDVDLSGCVSLTALQLSGCDLPAAAIDQMLADLVANGASDGYLLSYGNSSPSNPTGQSYVAILASRGWYIEFS